LNSIVRYIIKALVETDTAEQVVHEMVLFYIKNIDT